MPERRPIDVASAPATPPFAGVLLCPPDHFAVVDVKNAFMEGQQGRVDGARAADQWQTLADTYRRLGVAVHRLPPAPGCEDMVFTANVATVLPRAGGSADVVLSHMVHPSRQTEVPHVERWLVEHGFSPRTLPADAGSLEGHGDVLAVPGRRLALGGHGGRSEPSGLRALEAATDVPVIPLELVGDVFYHLDTCVALLDEDTALAHLPALTDDAVATLRATFGRILEADPTEAREELAVNVHGLPSGHIVMPAGARRTADVVAAAGFEPVLVDVSEFHKSGGSVFCMKLELPALGG